jgi:hypothetical protein
MINAVHSERNLIAEAKSIVKKFGGTLKPNLMSITLTILLQGML